jgi:alanine racemase
MEARTTHNRRMPRPIEAVIHSGALRHNLEVARAASPGSRVFAVVKANAYGHGIERVFDALRGADGFALLDLAEAERVRALGWRGPVLLLEGVFEPRDLETCSRLALWHVVHCAEQIDWIAAHKTQAPQRVFLKLNSGMNRLGFAPHLLRAAWARLSALPQVGDIELMTHFAEADRDDGLEPALAVARATLEGLPGGTSFANSAATLRRGHARDIVGDWVRCGIMLYGSSPDFPQHDSLHWRLEPTMSLRSRLIATQWLEPSEAVGYGATFRAQVRTRIGVAACGYADGYPRHATTGAPVLVDGVRTRLVGRVSMDMVTIDLTPVPEAGLGSEVTLWGRGEGGRRLEIDEVAGAAGTVGYELMCALAPRVGVRVD